MNLEQAINQLQREGLIAVRMATENHMADGEEIAGIIAARLDELTGHSALVAAAKCIVEYGSGWEFEMRELRAALAKADPPA